MKELIKEICSDSECLSKQIGYLKKLEYSYEIICGARTQSQVSVRISGSDERSVGIETTELDRGYNSVLKKGMEMINLGARKLYLSKIENQKLIIELLKEKIRVAAVKLAEI